MAQLCLMLSQLVPFTAQHRQGHIARPKPSPRLPPIAGGRQVRPEATTLLGKLKRLLMRMLLWGTSKVHQLLWRLRWLIYANGVFVALLIAIHLASPDPRPLPAAFPAACPREKRFGCRWADRQKRESVCVCVCERVCVCL